MAFTLQKLVKTLKSLKNYYYLALRWSIHLNKCWWWPCICSVLVKTKSSCAAHHYSKRDAWFGLESTQTSAETVKFRMNLHFVSCIFHSHRELSKLSQLPHKSSNVAEWKFDRASLGNGEPTYGLWIEFNKGPAGSSPLSVPVEAETQVRVTRSSLQSEPKANSDRPEVSCHRRLRRRRDVGVELKKMSWWERFKLN